MRLTLRTLLAYMDEILEPADREELAKKVESSDFAHDLIHRTKDTMRRLRLSAPQVLGSGIGLDPNTVAEYLDNVLPPDSVADFERICLESDVHLAEVASAHHVLTMVLGEPAEVDPLSRQRMYAIPAEAEHRRERRMDPAHVQPTAEQPSDAVIPPPNLFPAASVSPATPADAIPDYLRERMDSASDAARRVRCGAGSCGWLLADVWTHRLVWRQAASSGRARFQLGRQSSAPAPDSSPALDRDTGGDPGDFCADDKRAAGSIHFERKRHRRADHLGRPAPPAIACDGRQRHAIFANG